MRSPVPGSAGRPVGEPGRSSRRGGAGGAGGSAGSGEPLLWMLAAAGGVYVLADAGMNLGLRAATVVSGVSGGGVPPWSWRAVLDLAQAHGSAAAAFPALGASGAGVVVFWAVAAVVVAVVAAAAGWCGVTLSRSRAEARKPYRAMTGRRELRAMTGARAVTRARQLRPSLADTSAVKVVPFRDRGFAVGVPMGPERAAPRAPQTAKPKPRPHTGAGRLAGPSKVTPPVGVMVLPVALEQARGVASGSGAPHEVEPADVVRRRRRLLTWIHLSAEEVALAYMAPRSGKTTCLAVPAIVEAPGPVFVTGNKGDVVAATRRMRERDTGQRSTLFDPMGIMVQDQGCWFDLLGDVTTSRQATKLATYFMDAMVDDGGSDSSFWRLAGHDLLASLLLAAAVTPGRTLGDVLLWLSRPTDREPVELLQAARELTVAASLAGRQAGAPETIAGIYENARVAAACLQDEQMRAWVTPQPHLPVFDAAAFVRSVGTIYLLSKDEEAISAAPLVAAVTGQILTAAAALAERSGGRMDPPLTGVLDEAANICRLKNLPKLYSYSGSRGINLMTILQSKAQGEGVWGRTGIKALESAATVKLYGSGLQDPEHAGELSKLTGQWDVRTTSISSGRGSGPSRTNGTRREDILPVDEVAALPKQVGLMLLTGLRPAMIRYVPWWLRDYGPAIAKDVAAEVAQLKDRAGRAGVDWRESQLIPADASAAVATRDGATDVDAGVGGSW